MKPITRLKTYRAAKAFSDFTGRKASRITETKLDATDQAGYAMGPIVGIAYEANRDGETAQYFHKFSKKSRPKLVARDDGKQLYISGGSYKVTDRGIEDKPMPGLFIVNPSQRKRKRKVSAMAKRRRRRNSSGQFLRNPSRSYARRRKRRTSARRAVTVYNVNPRRRSVRRRRRRSLLAPLRMRRNPVRRRRSYVRRFRRNPIGRGSLGMNQILGLVVPGVLTGGGAVGAEVVMGYLPIPASWKTGYVRHLVKGALGVAGGLVIADVFKMKKLGEYFALGAIAIASHDALKDALSAQMPGLSFGSYLPANRLPSQFGYASPAQVVGMGEYVSTPDAQF